MRRPFDLLQKLRKDYSDGETSVHIVGFPMLMGWIYSLKATNTKCFCDQYRRHDRGSVTHLLWESFGDDRRHGQRLILTVWGLGFIGFTGINFNPMLYVLAFLWAPEW